MIPRRIPLRDLLPDPNHPRVPDIQTRHFFERTYATITDPNPIADAQTSVQATEPQRIRSVSVTADPSGDTASYAILVDGRTIVDSVTSGAGTAFPRRHPVFQAGSAITADLIGTTGVPTGPVDIVIEMDSFVVAPRTEVEPRGRDRLFLSRRREAERINGTIGELKPDASLARAEGTIGYGERTRERDIRNPSPIKRIDHRFRPRRPR